jgi:uncharacterized protein
MRCRTPALRIVTAPRGLFADAHRFGQLLRCRHLAGDCILVSALRVRIEYFGTKGQLLGAFHIAQRLQPRATAVLLCNPVGEEASRSHRTFRVFATQLERAGFSTLRFDYTGTGDSLGSAADASIGAWISDIEIAAQRLREVSGAQRIAVVGLRFGASLAMLCAARGGLRPRHLLMWDPIVDGASYLRELVVQHQAYMRDEIGPSWQDRTQRHADGTPTEAFGSPLSAALTAEILPEANWIDLPESTAWNSDAALNAMVVPMEIVQTLIAQIEKAT